jgi:site-specific recombinase XerD
MSALVVKSGESPTEVAGRQVGRRRVRPTRAGRPATMDIPEVTITDAWQAAIDGWLFSMQAAGFSPVTVASRRSPVRILARCMTAAGRTDPAEVTRADLTKYFWAKRKEAKPAAAATHHANLAKFWAWWAEDEEAPDPMIKVPSPKVGPVTPPDVLTDAEMAKLLAACAGKDAESIRNRAMILLLASSGIRRAELAALKLDDVNLSQRTVVIRHGKGRGGGKWRVTVISKAASLALAKWLRRRARMAPASDYVFISCRGGGALTPSGVTSVLYILGKRTGVNCHAHRFRHRWAHKNLAAGIGEHDLMKLAGWSSSQMINRYGAALATERALAAGRAIADQVG